MAEEKRARGVVANDERDTGQANIGFLGSFDLLRWEEQTWLCLILFVDERVWIGRVYDEGKFGYCYEMGGAERDLDGEEFRFQGRFVVGWDRGTERDSEMYQRNKTRAAGPR
jgi:hypothetical protein